MKSKLTIDLDEDNQPIILIHYNESEDVRDKMVKIFLQSFVSESPLAEIKYFEHENFSPPNTERKVILRPVKKLRYS